MEASVCMFVIPYVMKFYSRHYLARSLKYYGPNRLERLLGGIPSIIVGIVYHLPSAADYLILNYLYELLSKI